MTDRKSFLLRINPRLHRVLERWAAEDLRSINSQIEYLLVEAAKKSGRWVAEEAKSVEKTGVDQETRGGGPRKT